MISCIISTYNRSEMLIRAIDSVLAQTYKDFELIIVDDCSTDNTKHTVDLYSDKRIKHIKTPTNTGADPIPKNMGAKIAQGEYLYFLDDDNELYPHAFESTMKKMKKSVDVVYGDMWLEEINEQGITHDFDRQFLLLRNYIDTSEVLLRKSVFEYVGGFDVTLKKFIDWNLWVRIMKAGFTFVHLKSTILHYHLHENTKSNRVKTEMYTHPKLGRLFTPTFDPSGCRIRMKTPLGFPKVAIFTIHYDRLDYSKATYFEMIGSAGYKFDWFVWNNGTEKGTNEFLSDKANIPTEWLNQWETNPQNIGLTNASNKLVDYIVNKDKYDIIMKVDNDVEFITYGWLADMVELWKRNHMIYVSPYVEGLVDNPGGAKRVGRGLIGSELVEVTHHIGGITALISAKAYKKFRWEDKMLHGNQDMEASEAFRNMGYMPCYYPKHIIRHRDTTEGQHIKYKKYFKRRIKEKTHESVPVRK